MNPNILTMPLMEKFECGGLAPDILGSHTLAWNALEGVLGFDKVEAWSLKVITHTWVAHEDRPGVQFTAEFVRNPEFEEES